MDRRAKYVQAGRRFQSAQSDELKQQWIKAFEAFVLPDGRSLNGEMVSLADDIESEISLRGEPLPYEKAENAMAALEKAVLSVYNDTKADPEQHDKARERAHADFVAYQKAMRERH